MESTSNIIMKQELPQVAFTEKKQQRLKDNHYAPLDPKTQKILDKLKKRLAHIDQLITHEKIEDSKSKIQHWLERHTAERVPIQKNDFNIFSEGKNTAKTSRRVEEFRDILRNGFYQQVQASQDLKGRITKHHEIQS